tara:strand:- start:4215 stop:4415 length:201 start_codon:yes stop_codon:yes gene_type:complete
MEHILELVKELDIKIQILLLNKGLDEAEFLRMYAKSKSIQIAFAMGSRSMATKMAEAMINVIGEEE